MKIIYEHRTKQGEKMNFNNIIGNEHIKELLNKTIKNSTLTHSYLFIGTEGIGKKLFAKEFAKSILCLEEEKPCNNCKACIEFETSNNPDYFEIDTQENSIKIEEIRQMQSKIAEKPIISNKKVYIINDSEKMTKEAQNCLLKTLEEPPEYITIILITSNENMILNTIKSRCTKIVFNKIEDEKLSKYLKENYKFENITKSMLKAYSGSIKKALEMNEKKEIYEELDKYFYNIENYKIIDVLNKIECLYKNKENIQEMLEYINTILFEKSKTEAKYLQYIENVEQTKQKIKINANYDMTIDNLLLKIWRD